MGPTALFDKSFLQSLSVDEAVVFDHFFIAVICPMFYVETLADLEKEVRPGRTPEDEVRIIAQKTPEMHGAPCAHHLDLCGRKCCSSSGADSGGVSRWDLAEYLVPQAPVRCRDYRDLCALVPSLLTQSPGRRRAHGRARLVGGPHDNLALDAEVCPRGAASLTRASEA